MPTFKFDHSQFELGDCLGLTSATKIETIVNKWIVSGIFDSSKNKEDSDSLSTIMQKITDHKKWTIHEKQFAYFTLGATLMQLLLKQKEHVNSFIDTNSTLKEILNEIGISDPLKN